ncbi:MAG: endonuclease [Paludibacteraceae bacterium]
MKQRIAILFFGLILAACSTADNTESLSAYYATTQGLNQGELKTALYNIIKNPRVVGYDNLWQYFPQTDRKADGTVWDMYSDNTYYFPDDGTSAATGMDKEHAFPKSWWTSDFKADYFDCYSDLFNLNPADAAANQQIKSALPMAEIDISVTADNGVVRKGTSTLHGAYPESQPHTAWEPADEYKGDFARTYMYVVTCYEFISYASNSNGPAWSSTSGASTQITWNSSDTYPLLTDWTAQMLLEWHHNDPVSEKELNRNEIIYSIQGNRNPFIDCPDFADYIWGDKKNEPFDIALITGKAFFSMPKNGEKYAFKGDSINTTQRLKMQFRANNVSQPIALQIVGTSKGQFSLPQSSLTAAEATNGAILTLEYTSSIPARDTVQLYLVSDELAAPVVITLTAEAFDTFRVLEPIITDNAFTLRWTASADADRYAISVFQPRDTGEMAWINILDEEFVWQSVPDTWSYSVNSKGTCVGVELNQKYVKLASGSYDGFIQTPPLSVGDTVIISTCAAQYNNNSTANVSLTIAANEIDIVEHQITADFQIFTDTIIATQPTLTFRFTAKKGKQVWLDAVRIDTHAAIESQVLIRDEFPATTTDTHYTVSNLVTDEHYWYTIQPQGGTYDTTFGPFEVVVTPTAIKQLQAGSIMWSIGHDVLHLEQLPAHTDIMLYDLAGHIIYTMRKNTNYALDIPLKASGIFILHITGCQPTKILKTP